MAFSGLLAIFLGLGAAATFTGRLLVTVLGVGFLRRFAPASAAASAILGTGALIVASSALSKAGLTAPESLVVVTASLALLAVLSWRRCTLRALLPSGPAGTWIGLSSASLVAASLAMLPVLRENGFTLTNDTITYCSHADWFSRNSFAVPAGPDALQPITDFVSLYQMIDSRLGVAHLLSLATVASGASTSLLVIQAVSAWGIVLTLLGAFLVGRWVLRLPSSMALALVAAYSLWPHPLLWGHHNGFLQQAFGDANVLLGVAVLTRASSRCHWRPGTGALIGLLVVCQCYVYLQMLPILAAAFAWPTWLAIRHARKREIPRLLVVAATAAVASLLGATSDLIGVFWRVGRMLSGVAGWDATLTATEFVAFAAGTLSRMDVDLPPTAAAIASLHLWTTPALVLLASLGLARVARRWRCGSFLGVVATFVALVAYYGLIAESPWTGNRGHTFNVFKAVQWAFPWAFILLLAGLDAVRRLNPRMSMVVPWMIACLPATLVPVHWAMAESYGHGLSSILQEDRPLEALPAIKRRLETLPPGVLVFLNRPSRHHPWLGALAAILAHPRRIVGDWDGSVWIAPRPAANAAWQARVGTGTAVPILVGSAPFLSPSLSPLGGPFSHVRSLEPFVVNMGSQADRASALEGHDRPLQLGVARTRLVVFSGARVRATVQLRTRPGTPLPGPHLLAVLPGDVSGPRLKRQLDEHELVRLASPSCFTIPLSSGLNTVVLKSSHQGPQRPVAVLELTIAADAECPARPPGGARVSIAR